MYLLLYTQVPVKYPGSTVVSAPYASKDWAVANPEYNPVHYNAPMPAGEALDPPTVVMYGSSIDARV